MTWLNSRPNAPGASTTACKAVYSREELIQLLQAGADLEAYCSNCDETWPVSVEERADIARALERSK